MTEHMCECGVMLNANEARAYSDHIRAETHDRAMRVSICGPCFYGAHGYCHVRRGRWRCDCTHDIPTTALSVDDKRMTRAISDWMAFLTGGAPRATN